jgi:hypothetical protein
VEKIANAMPKRANPEKTPTDCPEVVESTKHDSRLCGIRRKTGNNEFVVNSSLTMQRDHRAELSPDKGFPAEVPDQVPRMVSDSITTRAVPIALEEPGDMFSNTPSRVTRLQTCVEIRHNPRRATLRYGEV